HRDGGENADGAEAAAGRAKQHLSESTDTKTECRDAYHDTRLIQDWLGHRAIQHTPRYTELSPTRFKEVWRWTERQPRLHSGLASSLRDISGALFARGYATPLGKPYSASAVQSMLG